MKKPISVVLILILSLGIIFSAPAGLNLFNAKAQSVSNLPKPSLPLTATTPRTIPPIPSTPIQTTPNSINISPNFNIQTPIRPGMTTANPTVTSGISPFLNPHRQQLGKAPPIPNAGTSNRFMKGLL